MKSSVGQSLAAPAGCSLVWTQPREAFGDCQAANSMWMNVSTVWCQEACWVTGFSETGGTNTCYTRVCVFPETRWSGAVRSPQGENIAFEAQVPIFVQPAAGGKKLEVFRYEKWSKRLHEAANYRKNPAMPLKFNQFALQRLLMCTSGPLPDVSCCDLWVLLRAQMSYSHLM